MDSASHTVPPPYPPPYAAPPAASRRGRGCLWTVIVVQSVVLGILLLSAFGLFALGNSLKSHSLVPTVGRDEFPEFEEVWSYGSGDAKVVNIPLEGFISLGEEEGMFSTMLSPAEMTLRSIRRATHDSDVKAILLTVDSGGGGITASDIIYNALLEFKAAQENRKVVALFGDVSASGAYYVAAASDHIIAHPTTITGSIGVLLQSLNIKGLGEKIGVRNVTIKSGKNKDILNPFEDLTPEQRTLLQALVDDMYERFVSIVATGRKMKPETVREIADGRIFTAAKARELGLVDQVGYWKDAVGKTAELLKVDNVKVYRYEEKFSFSELFKARSGWTPTKALTAPTGSQTRLLYLWSL